MEKLVFLESHKNNYKVVKVVSGDLKYFIFLYLCNYFYLTVNRDNLKTWDAI